MVLVNCSPLLRSVLEPLAGESRSVIILPKEITKVDLEYLMEYVYLGSVSVPADRLEGVTKAADFLKIHGIPPLTKRYHFHMLVTAAALLASTSIGCSSN